MEILKQNQDQFEWSKEDISSAAKEQGLIFNIPEEGSMAFNRLVSACEDYAESCKMVSGGFVKMDDEIANQFSKEHEYYQRKKKMSDKYKTDIIFSSDSKRRDAHDKLCVMITGKHRNEITPSMRERIALFALSVFEKKDLTDVANF